MRRCGRRSHRMGRLEDKRCQCGEFAPLEHKRLPLNIAPNLSYQVRDGDILMTRGSGSPDHVGMAALAEDRRASTAAERSPLSGARRACNVSGICRIGASQQPVRGRMALLFRGQSGQTIKLRAEDVRSIEIPNVPTRLQAQLASNLAIEQQAFANTRQGIEASNSLLAERRQALITAAVTGGITV